MKKQRLRNLTTSRLHTCMDDIYKDLEFITGIMTHMIPNVMCAVEPWLKEKVTDAEYWDGEHRPELDNNEHALAPMTEIEQKDMMERYSALPHPFENQHEPADGK